MESCVIYARFSSRGQNEQSIDGQVRICKEYAEKNDLNIVNIYTDKARTGTNDARPAFQQMIKDSESGSFSFVIVYMFDRFARNRRDSIMYKEMLKEKYGIKVVSALEPIADDEGGEFYEMFLEWNAEKYSKRLSKRVRDGLDTSVANGTFCGGVLIYGYQIRLEPVPGKGNRFIKYVDVNDEEAEILRFVFEQYDKGLSKKEIANILNERGVRYRGAKITTRTFDRALMNEKYTGEFYYGGRKCINTYPQIIDRELFDRVQERLHKNAHFLNGVQTAKLTYLLTGKLYCGHCGEMMVSDGGLSKLGVQHRYYTCKNKRKNLCNKNREDKEALELYVTQEVVNFLKRDNAPEVIAKDVISHYEKATDDDTLKSIQTKIANMKKDVEHAAKAYIDAKSVILREAIEKQMTETEILLNDLISQEKHLQMERGYKFTVDDIFRFINNVISGDPTKKDFQKRIIDNLVKKVIMTDKKTLILFNIKGGSNMEVNDDELLECAIESINRGSNVNTTCPPEANCTNTRQSEFVLFLLYECFGVRIPIKNILPKPPIPTAWQTQKRDEQGNFTK